jgi:IclR family transcriptional regulator, pca regulon regulatory protein
MIRANLAAHSSASLATDGPGLPAELDATAAPGTTATTEKTAVPAVRAAGGTHAAGRTHAAGGTTGAEGARRVLAVLQAYTPARHTLTARDLAESTGIPLPSMYRYIALLRETGLLIGDERGSYHLSARLISLARAAEAAESIIELADPVMRDLAVECGETVILVRLIARTPVCVHRVESAHYLRAAFEAGQPLPLERGATAKVLLSGLTPQVRREYLAAFAKADPAGAARLEEAAAIAAERGWAVSQQEIDRGVWAASAAVSDGGSVIAALTVPSPLGRSPAAQREQILGQVRSAAARLSGLIAAAHNTSGATVAD